MVMGISRPQNTSRRPLVKRHRLELKSGIRLFALTDPSRRAEARDVVVGGLKFTWSLPLAAGAGRGRDTDRRW